MGAQAVPMNVSTVMLRVPQHDGVGSLAAIIMYIAILLPPTLISDSLMQLPYQLPLKTYTRTSA